MINFNVRDEVIYKQQRGLVEFVDDTYIVIKGQASQGRDYPHLLVFPEDWKHVIVVREHKSDYGN